MIYFDPQDGGPSREAGRQLILARRPELAERELRGWLAQNPGDPQGHALLAWSLALQKRPEAVESAREAVRLAPDWGYTHASMTEVCLQLGRYRQAVEGARTAVALEPDNPACWALLAASLLNVHPRIGGARAREALQAAEAGLAADPLHADCARLRAQALGRMWRHRQAREAAAYALSLAPDSSLSHEVVGWLEVNWGDKGRARRHLREALRLDPTSKTAQEGLRLSGWSARFAAAMYAQMFARARPLAVLAAVFAAELAAVLRWADTDDALFVIINSVILLLIPGIPMLWARLRHPALVAELRGPGGLTRADRLETALIGGLLFFFLFGAPLAAILDPEFGGPEHRESRTEDAKREDAESP